MLVILKRRFAYTNKQTEQTIDPEMKHTNYILFQMITNYNLTTFINHQIVMKI